MSMTDVKIQVPDGMVSYVMANDEQSELMRNAILLYPHIKNLTISHGKAAEIDAWYWLDNVQHGGKAVSKDVYQESYSAYPDHEDGTGKWVRYDEKGHMVKSWQYTDAGTYYFEEITGAMAKGWVNIDGTDYYFDEVTVIRK